jgi:preprotein translocase subunit SecG
MYYIAIVMYGLIFMLALIWFVFLQMWRFSWTGHVCSGDFLPHDEKLAMRQNKDNDTYLIAEGNFLEGVIITIYCMFGLLFLAVLGLALFCSQKRSETEIAARKGGLFQTTVAPSYESKFVQKDRRPTTLGRIV